MMAADFSAELDELVEAVGRPLAEGEKPLDRASEVWTQTTDVLGVLVDSLDPENRDEELAILEEQAEKAARRIVARMKLRPLLRGGLNAAIPAVIPMALEGAADKSAILVEARDAWIVPGIDYAIRQLLRTRKGLAPDAPPLKVTDGSIETTEAGGDPDVDETPLP
jgi:hypothetical protein